MGRCGGHTECQALVAPRRPRGGGFNRRADPERWLHAWAREGKRARSNAPINGRCTLLPLGAGLTCTRRRAVPCRRRRPPAAARPARESLPRPCRSDTWSSAAQCPIYIRRPFGSMTSGLDIGIRLKELESSDSCRSAQTTALPAHADGVEPRFPSRDRRSSCSKSDLTNNSRTPPSSGRRS